MSESGRIVLMLDRNQGCKTWLAVLETECGPVAFETVAESRDEVESLIASGKVDLNDLESFLPNAEDLNLDEAMTEDNWDLDVKTDQWSIYNKDQELCELHIDGWKYEPGSSPSFDPCTGGHPGDPGEVHALTSAWWASEPPLNKAGLELVLDDFFDEIFEAIEEYEAYN